MSSFLQRFYQVTLFAILSLLVNLLTGYLLNDSLSNIFSPTRVFTTVIAIIVLITLIAATDDEFPFSGFWRWNRNLYLKSLVAEPILDKSLKKETQETPNIIEIQVQKNRENIIQFLIERINSADKDTGCRMLIVGEPGSGKTVAMKLLANMLAKKGRGIFNNDPIPVLLEMGLYRDNSFCDFIKSELDRRKSGLYVWNNFEKLLNSGQVILLCDAIDESSTKVPYIENFLLNRNYENTSVIITGRTKDVPLQIQGITEKYEIQDLNDNGVRTLIDFYSSNINNEEIFSILQNKHLLDPNTLGKNPFWLKLIVQNQQYIPFKGELLETGVDSLLNREINDANSWEKRYTIKNYLSLLAYQMTLNNTFFSYEDTTTLINNRLHEGQKVTITAEEVIGIGQDAQILEYFPRLQHEQIQSKTIRFNHLYLQAYLTAWAITLINDNVTTFRKDLLNQDFLNRCCDNIASWDSVIILGDIIDNPNELVEYVIGDKNDPGKLLLGIALLQNPQTPDINTIDRVLKDLISIISKNEDEAILQNISKAIGDEVINDLINLLRIEDNSIRKQAIRILSYTRNPIILDHLIELLEDRAFEIRNEIIRAFGVIQAPIVLDRLYKIFTNQNEDHRIVQTTVWAMGEIKDPRAIDWLLSRIPDNDIGLLQEIGDALRKIGKPAFDKLVQDLDNSNFDIRNTAANAIVLVGISPDPDPNDDDYKAMKSLAKKLHEMLIDTYRAWEAERLPGGRWPLPPPGLPIEIDRRILEAIKNRNDTRGFSTLCFLMADSDLDTKEMVASTFATMGEPAVPYLIPFLAHGSERIRERAKTALTATGTVSIDLLIEALNSDNFLIRGNAAQILGRIGDKGVIPFLQPLLNDEIKWVAMKAEEAIQGIKERYP